MAQTAAELKAHLRRLSGRPYVERIADFHLLLFLAGQASAFFPPQGCWEATGIVLQGSSCSCFWQSMNLQLALHPLLYAKWRLELVAPCSHF